MKIIIADDEKKVCQLIEKLVDWNALGMELGGFAHDGIEALKLIREVKPQIVITDIRMPGMDGLELIGKVKSEMPTTNFVVISGFKEFEYAQTAIQQGVSNYLLKPINEKELNHTLEKIKSRYQEQNHQSRMESEERSRLRQQLFSDYVLAGKPMPALQELNRRYHFRFQGENVWTAILKFDGGFGPQRHFHDKVDFALKEYLKACHDYERHYVDGRYVIVLDGNGAADDLKRVIQELLHDQDIFTNFSVCIGLGTDYKQADTALSQRLLVGTNCVIPFTNVQTQPLDLGSFTKEFLHFVEVNQGEQLVAHTASFLKGLTFTLGEDVLKVCHHIMEIYRLSLKKFHFEQSHLNPDELFSQLDNFAHKDDVFNHLVDYIKTTFQDILGQKESAESRPVTEAKKYINANFTKAITLEMVSENVGFSSAYFSTMFKAKTGESFTEYLFRKRMEEAKRQLRDTNATVAEICENVGYMDIKHFNKGFKKATRLKPKEYRKLYS